MKPADLLLFLLGNRRAIERIASSRRALGAGALLVASAGVARNYDHLDLLRQPEWIYGPFGMSLFSAVFIWMVLRAEISGDAAAARAPTFRTFLTFFWLTAPCAWLYGFPVERFTDLVTATQWNFTFLMVVSIWRVALIVRMVTVLTGAAVGRILVFVLVPASMEMFAGSLLKGLSLIGIMGGVRLPAHHEFLKQASDFVAVGAVWTGAASLLGMVIYRLGGWGVAGQPLHRSRAPEQKGVIRASVAGLAVWLLVAITVQGPVRNHFRLSQYFSKQQWKEGIAFAAARQRSDFSPIHFLPPDPYANRYGNAYFPLLEAMDGTEPAWLREVWMQQALIELELKLNFSMEPEAAAKVLTRFPTIAAGLARRAERLKTQPDPGGEDILWLENYEQVFGKEHPSGTVGPSGVGP